MSQSPTFTRSGFPIPNLDTQYQSNEVVFARLDPNLPYWPCQIKTYQSSTNTQTTFKIQVFNDPSISVVINKNVVGIGGRRKRRRNTIQRVLDRSKILKWNQKKKDGNAISFDDVIKEYILRKNLSSLRDIDDDVWSEWHDYAIVAAEDELERQFKVQKRQIQQKLEQQQLEIERQKEMEKQNRMEGQLYDGRTRDKVTGILRGWVLRAGDSIRYWKVLPITNENKLLTTRIIKLNGKYGTLRMKDCAPVQVELSGSPPFWETMIEKLPNDELNPIYYPLKQCKFIPSEIENQIENDHNRKRLQWDQQMRDKGWGNML
eukprot:217144_1